MSKVDDGSKLQSMQTLTLRRQPTPTLSTDFLEMYKVGDGRKLQSRQTLTLRRRLRSMALLRRPTLRRPTTMPTMVALKFTAPSAPSPNSAG